MIIDDLSKKLTKHYMTILEKMEGLKIDKLEVLDGSTSTKRRDEEKSTQKQNDHPYPHSWYFHTKPNM